jgi:hypothetical protein
VTGTHPRAGRSAAVAEPVPVTLPAHDHHQCDSEALFVAGQVRAVALGGRAGALRRVDGGGRVAAAVGRVSSDAGAGGVRRTGLAARRAVSRSLPSPAPLAGAQGAVPPPSRAHPTRREGVPC